LLRLRTRLRLRLRRRRPHSLRSRLWRRLRPWLRLRTRDLRPRLRLRARLRLRLRPRLYLRLEDSRLSRFRHCTRHLGRRPSLHRRLITRLWHCLWPHRPRLCLDRTLLSPLRLDLLPRRIPLLLGIQHLLPGGVPSCLLLLAQDLPLRLLLHHRLSNPLPLGPLSGHPLSALRFNLLLLKLLQLLPSSAVSAPCLPRQIRHLPFSRLLGGRVVHLAIVHRA